ncbi:MAG TPA: diaminopimelate decarboxylase [Clostridia bacterium]|nr:diaminopimelate decarboxylase [Clostridia bacterium]
MTDERGLGLTSGVLPQGLPGTMKVNARGHLEIGGVDTVKLAKRYKTPLYVFDEALIRQRCREYRTAFEKNYPKFSIAYAGKAFMTMAMVRIVEEEGLYLDVVSGGELYTALKAQFPPERIFFNGNNKSPDEIEMALRSGVGRIIVDSFDELDLIESMAGDLKDEKGNARRVPILLRVTPGVEAHTHHYIQTGREDSKFGFSIGAGSAMAAVMRVLASDRFDLKGIHCHIGSQLFDFEPFAITVKKMLDFRREVYRSTGYILHEVNFGGGLAAKYTEHDNPPSVGEFIQALTSKVVDVCRSTDMPLPHIAVEPGRSIIAEAGTTLYTVGTVKHIPGVRTYIAVDGGMTDNPRYALYQADYRALVANKATVPAEVHYAVAGKCCESGDMLIMDAVLPPVKPGDILAVLTTGAYCYSMASNYNRIPRPAAILVNGGVSEVIVERETYDDLVRKDRIPARLLAKKSVVLSYH